MITSLQNPRIRQIKALQEKKKERHAQGLFVIEGLRLAKDALECGVTPRIILVAPDLPAWGERIILDHYRRGAQVEEVTWKVMESLSDTETPQGLLAVVPFRPPALPPKLDFAVLLDTVRDPGNMGAILRSAAAAGVQAALLSPACVDAYNPKVVRAGMGAHFRMPLLQADWEEIGVALKNTPGRTPLRVISSSLAASQPCWQADFNRPVCLMVSSEAEGTSLKGLELADEAVIIPMPGKTESLNAAAAAAVLLFEVVRQRAAART